MKLQWQVMSCQTVTCTAVQSKMNMVRCGQAMLERRPLRIREFESSMPSQPVRSLLMRFPAVRELPTSPARVPPERESYLMTPQAIRPPALPVGSVL
jgi:hypothetical protein